MVAWRNQEAGLTILDEAGVLAHGSGDDRDPCRHQLKELDGRLGVVDERVVEWVHGHVAVHGDGRKRSRVDPAQQLDGIGYAPGARRLQKALFGCTVRRPAGNYETSLGEAPAHRGEHRDQ